MTENDLMLTAVLDCRRVDLFTRKENLTPEQQSRYENMQGRRAEGEPLQYIIGEVSFMGIRFFVDERVLIPRPETEILVEFAIEKAKLQSIGRTFNILDLGTGSGNIAIALARNVPDSAVTALDISAEALALAEKNAKANGVDHKVQFCQGNFEEYLLDAADQGKSFDMIISNPPYIPTGQLGNLPEDVQKEPRLALDGGNDGLDFYRKIIKLSRQVLNPGGFLLLEIGDGQSDDIHAIFAQFPSYCDIKFHKDYVGTDRIVIAQLSG